MLWVCIYIIAYGVYSCILDTTPVKQASGQVSSKRLIDTQLEVRQNDSEIPSDEEDELLDDDQTSSSQFLTNITLNDFTHLVDVQAGRSMEILNDQLASRPIRLKDMEDTITKSLEALNVSSKITE